MTVNMEVKQTENGRWALLVNGILIGDSKARFDADHAKVMLEKALGIEPPPNISTHSYSDLGGYEKY